MSKKSFLISGDIDLDLGPSPYGIENLASQGWYQALIDGYNQFFQIQDKFVPEFSKYLS